MIEIKEMIAIVVIIDLWYSIGLLISAMLLNYFYKTYPRVCISKNDIRFGFSYALFGPLGIFGLISTEAFCKPIVFWDKKYWIENRKDKKNES